VSVYAACPDTSLTITTDSKHPHHSSLLVVDLSAGHTHLPISALVQSSNSWASIHPTAIRHLSSESFTRDRVCSTSFCCSRVRVAARLNGWRGWWWSASAATAAGWPEAETMDLVTAELLAMQLTDMTMFQRVNAMELWMLDTSTRMKHIRAGQSRKACLDVWAVPPLWLNWRDRALVVQRSRDIVITTVVLESLCFDMRCTVYNRYSLMTSRTLSLCVVCSRLRIDVLMDSLVLMLQIFRGLYCVCFCLL